MNNENLEKGAPYRFKAGQSGNPGGRPRKRPISERYAELAELRLPEKDRIKHGLPKGATYGDALVAFVFKAALEGNPYAAREIREAIEGKIGQRQETTDSKGFYNDLAERIAAARARVAMGNLDSSRNLNLPAQKDTSNPRSESARLDSNEKRVTW